MKAVLNPILSKTILRIGGAALSVFLALSMMAAALPQPALAAGTSTATCAENYKVLKSDTKNSIADNFELKWWQIAAANHMAPNVPLEVGKTLCIPTKDWATNAALGTMTAAAVGKKLTVKMSGFNMRAIWNVRVKDASSNVTGYSKVGRLPVPQNGSVTGVFPLPQSLLTTPRLKVCVTNSSTSTTICKTINHIQ